MLFIYFGKKFTATARGQAEKAVECEFCGQQFSYLVERAAMAESEAPFFLFSDSTARHAERAAMKKLDRALRKAVDPVPCPTCAKYQPRMLPAARTEHRADLYALGGRLFVLLPLAVLGLLFFGGIGSIYAGYMLHPYAVPMLLSMAASPLPGLGVLIYRWVTNQFHDPNAESSEGVRRLLARQRVAAIGPQVVPLVLASSR